ncbi:diguanylate cyclase [Candidatus Oleimmundimicrobium sp.]|uniref:GGDEF domain-containing protein n=1 Tax=Candidatus Oleimmundimicrobium sp. TaxID=3060597 RepID=UPI002719E637|nr:diguanylate cyclase [Candidatus Oleimmundimicrobium sp.]MDO8886318.1 diguanylate cyclase [Candidatus Oleimmundimicrobium sp.]
MQKPISKSFILLAIIVSFGLVGFLNAILKDFVLFSLFYLPLILATIFFDLRGGVLVPLCAAIVLFIVSDAYLSQIGIEILIMFVVGLTLGQMSKKYKEANDRLTHLSMVDKLTGLHNYGYFIDRIEEERERADRFGSKMSLIMLDIDFFKPFNDKFGHVKGNELLKKVTRIINEQVRVVDIVTRYGVEEFAIILPNTSGEAAEVAERIRKAVEEADFEDKKITISAGVATYPSDARDDLELIDRADQALNFSKNQGRNRVSVYSKDLAHDARIIEPHGCQ